MRLKSSQVNRESVPSASVSTSANTTPTSHVGRRRMDFMGTAPESLLRSILCLVPGEDWIAGQDGQRCLRRFDAAACRRFAFEAARLRMIRAMLVLQQTLCQARLGACVAHGTVGVITRH